MTEAEMRDRLIEPCSLGVGCDETGVCYADAHGRPEMCGRSPPPPPLPEADGERGFGIYLDVPLSQQAYSATSWNGHNVFGNRKSIDAVRRALHSEDIEPALRREIVAARARAEAAIAERDKVVAERDEALQMVKALRDYIGAQPGQSEDDLVAFCDALRVVEPADALLGRPVKLIAELIEGSIWEDTSMSRQRWATDLAERILRAVHEAKP